MSNLRPESHVAQQIRREKLRIQNSYQPSHEFPNNLEQLSLHPGFNNLDLVQVRNVRNANMLDELAVYSSEMPNFSTSSSAARNALEYHQEQGAAAEPSNRLLLMNQYGSFPHSMSAIHSSHKQQCELRNLGNWRNSTPHQGSDWFVNYASNANSFLSAQQLLDEICCLSDAKFGKSYDVSKRVSPEVSASTSADTVTGVAAKGSNSGSSSTTLYNVSKENRADPGVGSSFGLSSRSDYQHKKAKLLYMQEEVCFSLFPSI